MVSHSAHSAFEEIPDRGKSCAISLYSVPRNARLGIRYTFWVLRKIKTIASGESNIDLYGGREICS